MMKDAVSVIITTFNQQEFIVNAIESVLSQEGDIISELIIADDCSTDDTKQIIDSYYQKNKHLILPVYRQENLGVLANFYDALLQCKAKYITCMGGDDYWIDKNKLTKQVDFLENNNNYSIMATNYKIWNKENNTYKLAYKSEGNKEILIRDLIISNFLPLHTAIFRQKYISELPTIYNGEDGKLALFLLSKGHALIDTNAITAVYTSSLTGLSNRHRTYREKVNNQIVKIKKAEEWNKYLGNKYNNSIEILRQKTSKNILYMAIKNYDIKNILIHINQLKYENIYNYKIIFIKFLKIIIYPFRNQLNHIYRTTIATTIEKRY